MGGHVVRVGRALLALAAITALYPGPLQADEPRVEDLADLDVEALMEIAVTSVAGVASPLRSTPAAIHVITAQEIRDSGHRTLVEALRMVPGVDVARISSSIWAISVRGFNDRFSTKLLVMIDGRAVYNSLFSGVFWDAQDTVLEDVERIEVIRGPGATLWGANAVNGVINIVTKRARASQGVYAATGTGTHEEGFGTIRYGGKLGEETYFRVFGKYFSRDGFRFENGEDASDDWRMLRGGFRIDFEANPDTTATVSGEIYDGTEGSPIVARTLTPPFAERLRLDTDVDGAHLLVRVERLRREDSGWTVQAYYDRAKRDRPGFLVDERRTVDVELRHHFPAGQSHTLMWGVGYRRRTDDTAGSFNLSYDPADRDLDKFSAFFQDTLRMRGDRVRLLLGSKFEYDDFTRLEVQPSVRVSWSPTERQSVWAAVARAVRTPSRGSDDLVLTVGVVPPPTGPLPVRLLGNSDIESEELHAYEIGYRCRPVNRLTLDFAGFYNDYDELISIGAPTASPFDITFSNDTTGSSHGLELSARWDASDRVRASAAYSWIDVDLDGIDEDDEGTGPEHQLNAQLHFAARKNFELNAAGYFVDELANGPVDSYVRFDAGLTWRPSDSVELSLWGQNLFDSEHVEFVDSFFVVDPIEIERGVYGRASLRF